MSFVRTLALACPLAACFADVGSGSPNDHDAETSSAAATSTAGSISVSSTSLGTMGGEATSLSDEGSTSDATSTSTASSETTDAPSSSSSGGDPSFCAAQSDTVVFCRDFDDENELAGLAIWEQHGTVALSNTRSVSSPQSMRVVADGDPSEETNASVGQQLFGLPTPFVGELALQVWIDDECFSLATGPERLLMSLAFADAEAVDGPYLLNFTIWVTTTDAVLYVSDEGQGFPSDPYPLGMPFPVEQWVPLSLAFDASGDVATVSIGAFEENVQVTTITDTVTNEIADLGPAFSVGTAMGPNLPSCSIWYDDVTIEVE